MSAGMTRPGGNDGGECGNDGEFNLLRPGRNPCRKINRILGAGGGCILWAEGV